MREEVRAHGNKVPHAIGVKRPTLFFSLRLILSVMYKYEKGSKSTSVPQKQYELKLQNEHGRLH